MTIPDRGRHFAAVAAAIVAALGIMALAGWAFGLQSLTTLLPGLNSMKPNTALGLLLCSASLGLGLRPHRDRISLSLAFLAGLLGFLSLAEYLLGIDLHVDQMIWRDQVTMPDHFPGRMSTGTAMCFILFAANRGIAGSAHPVLRRVFVISLFCGLVVTYLTLIGYIYQTPLLSQPSPDSWMAVPTTIAFMLIFCGLMATRPDLGWAGLIGSPGAGGWLFRWLSPVVLFLPVAIGWLRLQGELANLYEMRTGLLLFTSANILLLFLMLTFAAFRAERIDAERRASRASLDQSESIYRTTFHLAPVGIVHLSPEGRFLGVNEFFCALVGYRAEELLATDIFAITHPDDMGVTRAGVDTIGKSARVTKHFTKRYVHKDGAEVWCEVTYTVHLDAGGASERSIAVVQDISERRRGEEAQAHLAAQLLQAQKMEAIGQLTGGMAHDFNNLLGVVLGNLDFLRDLFPPGSDGEQLTNDATTAAIQGSELIRRLLAFARRQPLSPELTQLAAIIEGAGTLLRRTLGEQISLSVKMTGDLWPVMVDVAQLEAAIINLAVNARHAMPHGGFLVIEARNVSLDESAQDADLEAVPGDYLLIAVSDTGTGMSPDILAKVFEPFFTTKGAEGSGLGLSMVHGFVKQSGGHTRIYSEEGRGTTVRIFLPRAGGTGRAAPEITTAPVLATGREVILVVEDNEALRRVTLKQVQRLGYETIAACDAQEALEMIRDGVAFDLLFTDIVMPGGMDGRELAAVARTLRPTLPVLFTSGFTEAASDVIGGDLNGNLLSKPYRKEELAERLRAALDAPAVSFGA